MTLNCELGRFGEAAAAAAASFVYLRATEAMEGKPSSSSSPPRPGPN